MKLDLTRATKIYGSSRATWFQEGYYFDREGNLMPPEEAAKPDPADVVPTTGAPLSPPVTTAGPMVEPLPATTGVSPLPETTGRTPPEYVAVIDRPVVREPEAKNWGEDKFLKLKALKATALAAMVLKVGGTPATGMGGKKKNIEWLMANFKD